METWRIKEVHELEGLAEALIATIEASDQTEAVIVALSGQLGAGKTAFVQSLARHLGVTDPVTSPTFVIMKSYELNDQAFDKLVHIDAYRIESTEEMKVLGWQELITTPRTLVCIEWPEKIDGLMPNEAFRLNFTIVEDERVIDFDHG